MTSSLEKQSQRFRPLTPEEEMKRRVQEGEEPFDKWETGTGISKARPEEQMEMDQIISQIDGQFLPKPSSLKLKAHSPKK